MTSLRLSFWPRRLSGIITPTLGLLGAGVFGFTIFLPQYTDHAPLFMVTAMAASARFAVGVALVFSLGSERIRVCPRGITCQAPFRRRRTIALNSVSSVSVAGESVRIEAAGGNIWLGAHLRPERLEAVAEQLRRAVELQRGVALELEAAPAPEGTGTELEAAPRPAGRGTELSAGG